MKKTILLIVSMLIFAACAEKKQLEKQIPLYELETKTVYPVFDAHNAFEQIKIQVEFGPRNPNSIGHKKAREYFINYLQPLCDKLELQEIIYPGYDNEQLELTNIIAKYNPDAERRILICAHWDTRPRADMSDDNKEAPIPGANDGGSGTGVILELAKILKANPVSYGVDLILFDGEDYGTSGDLSNYCIGSKYFSAAKPADYKPAFGVLLDLVGDKDAKLVEEPASMQYASDIVTMVWGIAKKIGADKFRTGTGTPMYDDHIPLNQAGIRTINIIDSELVGTDTPDERRNYWHTRRDVLDNIGEETLQQVGDVMVNLLYSIKFNR